MFWIEGLFQLLFLLTKECKLVFVPECHYKVHNESESFVYHDVMVYVWAVLQWNCG